MLPISKIQPVEKIGYVCLCVFNKPIRLNFVNTSAAQAVLKMELRLQSQYEVDLSPPNVLANLHIEKLAEVGSVAMVQIDTFKPLLGGKIQRRIGIGFSRAIFSGSVVTTGCSVMVCMKVSQLAAIVFPPILEKYVLLPVCSPRKRLGNNVAKISI